MLSISMINQYKTKQRNISLLLLYYDSHKMFFLDYLSSFPNLVAMWKPLRRSIFFARRVKTCSRRVKFQKTTKRNFLMHLESQKAKVYQRMQSRKYNQFFIRLIALGSSNQSLIFVDFFLKFNLSEF